MSLSDAAKAAKEAFVTGHAGTSINEITGVACSFIVSAWTAQLVSLGFLGIFNALHMTPSVTHVTVAWVVRLIGVCLEFAVVTGSAVAACLRPELIPLVLAAQAWLVLILLVFLTQTKCVSAVDLPARPVWSGLPAVSRLRAGTLLLTAVAILGVDFHAFPRRFAKTERFGTGLMDVGVGMFVVINALVSPLAKSGFVSSGAPALPSASARLRVGLVSATRSSGFLLILGLLRAAANDAVNYQLHLTEYGQHWSFFVTLAAVLVVAAAAHAILPDPQPVSVFTPASASGPASVSVFAPVSGPGSLWGALARAAQQPRTWIPALGGLLLSAAHQTWLLYGHSHGADADGSAGAGTEWVFGAPRTSLLTANKEGVASLPGYVALFLLAAPLGRLLYAVRAHAHARPGCAPALGVVSAAVAIVVAAAAWAATALLTAQAQPVSRCLANSAFVAWQLALAASLLAAALLIECAAAPQWLRRALARTHGPAVAVPTAVTPAAAPAGASWELGSVLGAVDAHPLLFFLVTNLCTGAVNLAVDTLSVGDAAAAGILGGYLAVAVGGTSVLGRLPARAALTALSRRAPARKRGD